MRVARGQRCDDDGPGSRGRDQESRARRLYRARDRQHGRLGVLHRALGAGALRHDRADRLGGDGGRRDLPRHGLRAPGAHRAGDRRPLCLHADGVRPVRRLPDRVGLLDLDLGLAAGDGSGARGLSRLAHSGARRPADAQHRDRARGGLGGGVREPPRRQGGRALPVGDDLHQGRAVRGDRARSGCSGSTGRPSRRSIRAASRSSARWPQPRR